MVKEAQRTRRAGGMANVLLSSEWSEWLPIFAWVIHQSVIVRDGDVSLFLAGDVSYTQGRLVCREPDGVGRVGDSLKTIDRVLAYSEQTPTVYLPSHDPDSAARLAARTTVRLDAAHREAERGLLAGV